MTALACWCGASGQHAWDGAAHEVAERAGLWRAALDEPPFVLLAATPHHARRLTDLAARVQHASGGVVAACVTPRVDVAGHRAGRGAALGVWAVAGVRAPHAPLDAFADDPALVLPGESPSSGDAPAGVLLLAPQSSTPTVRVLPAISGALGPTPLLGALLPSSDQDLSPVAIADADGVRAMSAGLAVALQGGAVCTPLLAQGCRPVGPARTLTDARGTLLLTLDDQPALLTLQRAAGVEDLRGWCLALVPGEHAAGSPGRDDVVIREIRGQDSASSGVALPEPVPHGTRVQLHRPDPSVALADLELLLDIQRLREPPLGALLVRSLDRPGDMSDDTRRVERAFERPMPGPERARAGRPVDPDRRPFPVLALGAGAEIAAGRSGPRVHALTASAWLVRAPG